MKSDSVGVNAISDRIEALDLKAIADRKVDFNTLIGSMVSFSVGKSRISQDTAKTGGVTSTIPYTAR